MEEFKEIYGELYNLLRFIGLWPINEPTIAFEMIIKRIAIPLITFLCLVEQYLTLFSVEFTMDKLVSTMAFSGPMLLFFVRYVSFLLAISTIRSLFTSMQNDFEKWKNTVEVEFLQQFIDKAKLLYYYYLRLVTFTVVGMTAAMIPIITQTKYQVTYLRYFGFYYTQGNLKTTCVCLHITFVYCVGIFCVLGTEISVSACSHHICGVLRAASYKLTTSINDLAKSTTARTIDIAPAVKLHLQAINMVESIAQDLGLSYMVTIFTAVISFALNLCRVFLAIAESHNFDEAIVPLLIILSHVIMMFLSNHCGQEVSNTSLEIFDAAYNSLWYYIPLKARKLVMFVMLKSSKMMEVNLLSLYTAGYEGCSMMLSTSFSYFTVIYSVH
ncbi:uncharacterized protein LOC143260379 [Megalopta genalis]|uniref:uncharacterized protein LOC143260379 n=1 Tax=Megalopta genalis TaxID=115081 RepID=UPI003FD16940